MGSIGIKWERKKLRDSCLNSYIKAADHLDTKYG